MIEPDFFMTISQAQFVDFLTEYRKQNWRGIQTPERQREIIRSMVAENEPVILSRIAPHWQLPADPLILDLGSGVGNFVVACRKRGLRAYGIEPDRIGQGASLTSLQIARKRLDSHVFAAATGEQLPFRESTFDLVVLDQVIEHVQEQKQVVSEALRVVKPTGAIYMACPNYLRFFEPHYRVWFLPLMPKFLGAFYLRLRRRDPVLLRQLTYTNNWRLRRLLASANFVDLNETGFINRLKNVNQRAATRRGRIAQALARVSFLSPFVVRAASFYVRLREGGSEFVVFAKT